MDGNSEQLQVINLKQLPIIEERLRDVKAKIEQRTSAVMALAVTEETRTDVKKIRTEVRKELEGYEAQRMVLPNRPSGLPEKERTCYAGYSVVKVLGNGLYPLKRKASENGVCRHTIFFCFCLIVLPAKPLNFYRF